MKRLELCWIKAHVGHKGNEEADDLAKEGALNTERKVGVGLSKAEVKNSIGDYCTRKWMEQWEKGKTCRQTKAFLPKPDRRKSKKIGSYGKARIRELIEAITGHNNLNYLQAKIDTEIDPTCSLCLEGEETILHMINSCPALERQLYELNIPKIQGDGEWEVEELLKFLRIQAVEEMMQGLYMY